MWTLWLLCESSISKSPYLSCSLTSLFLPQLPSLGSACFREAVRFSFAVAKIEQKLNTNQIFPRKSWENAPTSCIHFPINKILTGGEKNSILSAKVGWRGAFCLLKRGVKEEDDGTIKQDKLRECALMSPTGQAKRWPNASYIAPIGRRGQAKTRYWWVSYQEGKRGKCTYNNVRAQEKRMRRVIYRSKLLAPSVLMLSSCREQLRYTRRHQIQQRKGGDQHLLITASNGWE